MKGKPPTKPRRVAGTVAPAGGGPLDLDLVVRSHGWWDLEPFEYDREKRELRFVYLEDREPVAVTVAPAQAGPRALRAHPPPADDAALERAAAAAGTLRVAARGPTATRAGALAAARRVLDLDADLGRFHGACEARAKDGFAWIAARGAGRMLRAPTVFEDAVKVLATTNCTWAVTRGIVSRLVAMFGRGGAFPDAAFLARVPEKRLVDEARMGYRAAYLSAFARRVASGELDLARWEDPSWDDAALEAEIRKESGFGPYAAGTLGRLLGRHRALALDSWSRPKVSGLRFKGRKVKDARIEKVYRPFGAFAGLAFWLDVTRDWHDGNDPLWP